MSDRLSTFEIFDKWWLNTGYAGDFDHASTKHGFIAGFDAAIDAAANDVMLMLGRSGMDIADELLKLKTDATG